MIESKDVSLVYPDGTVALKDVNLNIEGGDLVYIIGPSGSGKTSLLKLFMGIEYPNTGSLKVLGQAIQKGEDPKIRKIRRKKDPVFQEFRLLNGRSALDNLILGMRFLDIALKEMKKVGKEALEIVGLGHKKDTLVEHLSWGESQRVAIARAIARKPSLIIADEPTGNLDVKNALNILDLLISLKDENTAVIITTHATHLIDRLEEGKLIQVNNGKIQLSNWEGSLI